MFLIMIIVIFIIKLESSLTVLSMPAGAFIPVTMRTWRIPIAKTVIGLTLTFTSLLKSAGKNMTMTVMTMRRIAKMSLVDHERGVSVLDKHGAGLWEPQWVALKEIILGDGIGSGNCNWRWRDLWRANRFLF